MVTVLTANTVSPDLTPIAEWLGAQDPDNVVFAFWIMYIIVNVLSVIVFNLGFARKLPLLKNVIIYGLMFFGNIFMTFLALALPIIESLFIAALVLGIYKLQLRRHQRADTTEQSESH
ncbi:YlaH-like family protein [Salipaludibacillus agaradhaerens]|jgi:type IV secretory pathway TrbL component|uniref:YlaH-like family protein n=1 Tax=Salipaludibacillus agaradhaerens TaxID=76935 RepID=A0A9Q4FYM8_SALAG|nr:YlaH-like family protein [Salipaludibacillus agaradhaerens]UJW58285.1 YlaH-like family protein [Bacillus sp. A116_S68]MCR6095899.1 YlaH-like family protein [Salipaludibacillus agaradhaerens]MCR6107214.1 YlaH-like family protein [Salipaludibacillus agaradhaerens]MCR6114542.1 YlaH-like family protein [Salipaludibacillus agaradhaerens]MCR6119243.1 YlaH-like family protein [Salipaludibacillus agaradhaerens]